MVQILPYIPSFGEKLAPTLAQGVADVAKGYSQGRTNQKDNQILQGLMSQENLSPMQQFSQFAQLSKDRQTALSPLFSEFVKSRNRREEKQAELQIKKQEKTLERELPIKAALETVQEQKELLKKGNLGRVLGLGQSKFGSRITKEGRKDRAKAAQLGKSLIQYASNIPIRNRLEFETLAHGLIDPSLHQSEIEGNLEAIEKILTSQLDRPKLESFYQ